MTRRRSPATKRPRTPPRGSSRAAVAAHLGSACACACACVLGLAACPTSEYRLSATASEAGETGETAAETPCADGVRQPWETDVDCGGPICEPCGVGLGCEVDADCGSGICAAGLCSDDPCDRADPCPQVNLPCLVSACVPGLGCVIEPAADGLPCDGLPPDPGDPNMPPVLKAMCMGGACVAECGPCSDLDGPCRVGLCNPQSGACGVEWIDEGGPCLDPDTMSPGICAEGRCLSEMPARALLYAFDFDDPNAGWTAEPPWEIGPAAASACAASGIDDPAADHSRLPEGGLAGLLIGGCLPPEPLSPACLTSPPLDLKVRGEVSLRYWEILDLAPAPSSVALIEAFDGQVWQPLAIDAHQIGPEWTLREVSLSALANPTTQLRFCAASMGIGPPLAGWSVDDLTIECTGCAP